MNNYPPCPMGRMDENKQNRDAPKNREMAFAFQFHDTAHQLFQMSLTAEPSKHFAPVLLKLESEIRAYRQIGNPST